ncbi:MAG: hypothetical protein IPK53_07450 [bacterium]|nr:hypothetical protein [bacterium]
MLGLPFSAQGRAGFGGGTVQPEQQGFVHPSPLASRQKKKKKKKKKFPSVDQDQRDFGPGPAQPLPVLGRHRWMSSAAFADAARTNSETLYRSARVQEFVQFRSDGREKLAACRIAPRW